MEIKKIKNGLYTIKGWYIARIEKKWYLLSNSEFLENKNNLVNFIKNNIICSYKTKKDLIKRYKNELFYKYIFE